MIERNDAVPSRANNDESHPDTATEVLNSDVIKSYAYRAQLFEQMKNEGNCPNIIEAGLDD